MKPMPLAPDDPDFVNALARGLSVITSFGQHAEIQTLSEVAAKTSLSRGTARRLLLTLEALGYVRSDGKTFRLAARALNLGYAYLSSLPIWKMAQPIMKEVVTELDESCSLGVLDDHDVVYIARLPPKHLSFLPVNLGTRMPAHINAMGQVLLAEFSSDELDRYFANAKFERITRYTPTSEGAIRKVLARVAKDRYALSDQQLQLGLRSIAVPVPFKSGRAEVAINVSARYLVEVAFGVKPFQVSGGPGWLEWISTQLSHGSLMYMLLYAGMIIFFAYFYTAVTFNPVDVADNMRKYGGFIPGIRPGKATAAYIDRVLTRITFGGAIYISTICVLPSLLSTNLGVPFSFGGTGLMIVVGVALDTVQQIESHLITRNYEGFTGPKGPRIRGRGGRMTGPVGA